MVDNQALLAEKKAREFQKILAEMTSYLSKSSNEIDTQGNIVDTYTKELSQTTSLDTISKIAKSIISETKSIVESSKTLKGQLDSTRAEINILSKELEGIKQVAKIDMLTGFLTGGDLMRRWADVLEKRKTTHEPVSVIMLDIDHFKNVNDTYGHLIGDNILQMLSKLLKERMTPCTRQKRPVEIKRLLSLILRNNLTKISFLCS
ncbi:MAG: GGDEF domain-containing protein [Desulfobacula sp.]|nr:GGDEF domain-containing protein [Desulfobacula sp.]